MGYDDDDEPEYEDLLEPPPENAPSNYAEPPELPPFKKNKKKAKRSRWERYQVSHTSSLSFTPHTHTNTHHTASAYFDSLSLSLSLSSWTEPTAPQLLRGRQGGHQKLRQILFPQPFPRVSPNPPPPQAASS
jgi:hypothetical protein